MIKFMRSAVVVVACLFAGSGAWADTFRQTAGDAPTYAAELFGSDDQKITYPTCAYVPGGAACGEDDTTTADVDESMLATNSNSPWVRLTYVGDDVAATANAKGMVTFSLSTGAFATTVGSNDLHIAAGTQADGTDQDNADTIMSVSSVSGGTAGESSVTFELSNGTLEYGNTFTLVLPQLNSLTALANPRVAVSASTTTIATGGTGFPHNSIDLFCPSPAVAEVTADTDSVITGTVDDDGNLNAVIGDRTQADAIAAGARNLCDVEANPAADTSSARVVVKSADAVKLMKTSTDAMGDSSVRISLEDRGVLVANSASLSAAADPYNPHTFHVGADPAAQLASLTLTVATSVGGAKILQLDGTTVDFALAGTLSVSVTGSNDLFGEDDIVFVNWNDPSSWHHRRSVDQERVA